MYLDSFPCLAPLEVIIINKSKRCNERGFIHVKISNQHAILQTTKGARFLEFEQEF